MTQPFRVASGGQIDRARALRFTFDGKSFEGHAGDTLASALLANGVHLTGRSFKYHRPRGIMSAGSEEPNALVTIDKGGGRITPNLRATTVELYEGLNARTQNAWPSIRFDLGAITGFVSPLLPAGFYYKTFKWPASFWSRLYEPAIRAAAGLGRAPGVPDPDRYLHRYAHCDVLIIGAGPAGLAAAKAAAKRDERIIICDEQPAAGGSLLSRSDIRIDGQNASEWIKTEGVTMLTRTTAFGWYPGNMIALAERVTDHLARPDPNLPRERLWFVRAKRVIIATGAIERPSVFPGNDRPGIMLAGAAATYLHRYGVLPGRRIVVTTSHDSAWLTAFALHQAGAAIAAIIDQRATPAAELIDRARTLGIPILTGAHITGTGGRKRVRFVQTDGNTIHCDTVLMSDGWTPSVHLFSQSRGKLRFDEASGTFLPGESAADEQSIGACAGTFDLALCLAEGHRAGGGAPIAFNVENEPPISAPAPPMASDPHGKAFVDFQNDVTTKDLAIATGEGFRSIEHVKRYTTTGMATDQGKTSNLNALATVAALTKRPLPEIGLTTFRPPYTPVTFGTFAGASRGDLFDPVRRTPIDDQDAVFEDSGNWKRALYFPRGSETMREAVTRECLAVRNDLGLFDASTLGKIEVTGPDAAEFLNRIYTGDFTRLQPGRCKYGVLLGEDGFIRDDGVIARLAPDRFHVTTTTGGAGSMLHHMEDYRQTEFTTLRVWLTSVTEQWATIAVQGPRAADALMPDLDGIDLNEMPHMSVRECQFAGVPVRLFRVSFTGELGFELNLPANFGRTAWDLLRETGATRYGTEAMHVLRAEMGFVIVGQETDGTVIPDDLGLGWTIARSKPDFVGKRSLTRPDMVRADRKQLVGLLPTIPNDSLEEGAQITDGGSRSIGHITSAYHYHRSFALALLANGRARIGTKLHIPMPDRSIEVLVTSPVFVEKSSAVGVERTGSVGNKKTSPEAAEKSNSVVVETTSPLVPEEAYPAVVEKASTVVNEKSSPETTEKSSSVVVEKASSVVDAKTGPVAAEKSSSMVVEKASSVDVEKTSAAVPEKTGTVAAENASSTEKAFAGQTRLKTGTLPANQIVEAPLRLPPAEPCAAAEIKLLPPTSRFNVRAEQPLAPTLSASVHDAFTALWLGPDEYLVLGAGPPQADSVVDVSHRTVAMTIEGPKAAWCVNAFCALDLDAMPKGGCTRTLLGKAEIILWRTGPQTFHIETPRSFAPYIWSLLREARREFLPPAAPC